MTWTLADSGVVGTALGNAPGFVYTFPGGAASAGDLLTLWVSSDTSVNTPAGYASPVSDVHNIGAYHFSMVAAGGETSVTIITNGNFPTEIGFLRYSGAAASPLDVTVSAFRTANANTTPAATTAVLAVTGELVIAAACLGGLNGAVQTSPTWSSGYTGVLDGTTGGTGATDQRLFVGTNSNAGTAAESPSVSWTNSTINQTLLVASYKPASGGAVSATPQPVVVPQAAVMQAANW